MVGAMYATRKLKSWKRFLIALTALLLCGVGVLLVVVEREADYTLQPLGGDGEIKALILYHPSRDAHFTDDLSLAIAEGLKSARYRVDRSTVTGTTPDHPTGYGLIVVVSNTFFFTPDLPSMRYLKRARLDGIPTIGVIAGAGATTRSQRMLEQALVDSGAKVISMHAFWTAKPNDEKRMTEPNRMVALQLARELGTSAATGNLAPKALPGR
jgi:hypothetical protein